MLFFVRHKSPHIQTPESDHYKTLSAVAPQTIHRSDVPLMRAMVTVFGEAFKEADTYTGAPPSAAYVERLLGSSHLIALAATKHRVVVGGLVAYELQKFEQDRTEIYIYDIAVAEAHRRQGVATALIGELKTLAAARNCCTIYVQADPGCTRHCPL